MSESRAIPLTKGKQAIVDADDYERLSQVSWYYQDGGGYACRKPGNGSPVTYMHREVASAEPGQLVDHINGDKLDNRKANLRLVSASQNMRNLGARAGTSKYKGVYWENYTGKWRSIIQINKKRIPLGRFTDEAEAARAYDEVTRLNFGEFGRYNFPREGEASAL